MWPVYMTALALSIHIATKATISRFCSEWTCNYYKGKKKNVPFSTPTDAFYVDFWHFPLKRWNDLHKLRPVLPWRSNVARRDAAQTGS